MAFSSILEQLSFTSHKDASTSPLMESISQPLRKSLDLYKFALSKEHTSMLQAYGINVSGLGSTAHPHPAHKTIELHLLFDHWSFLATSPSTVMFMKESKFNKLSKAQPNFQSLLNFHLHPKDFARYGPDPLPLAFPETPLVFMHDALMYYTRAQILDLFFQSPKVSHLYASLIIPPEADFTDLSMNPALYQYQFLGQDLLYSLESNPSAQYTQPQSSIEWLKTTVIHSTTHPGLSLSVTVLESWGPVHSLLISRLTPKSPVPDSEDKLLFKTPDCVLLPPPLSLNVPSRDLLVPAQVYHNLFLYVRAVRTLRVTDPSGFIRTQNSKPEYAWVTSNAWDHLAQFMLLTCPIRPNSHFAYLVTPLLRLRYRLKTLSHSLLNFLIPAVPFSFLSLGLLARRLFSSTITQIFLFRSPLLASKDPPVNNASSPVWTRLADWFLNQLPSFVQRKLLPPSPRLPIFKVVLEPKSAQYSYPSDVPPLFIKFAPPRILQLFRQEVNHVPGWLLPLTLSASAVSALYLLFVRFSTPSSPQELSDSYRRYFHPKPWKLFIDRKAHFTPEAPFFPKKTENASILLPDQKKPISPPNTTKSPSTFRPPSPPPEPSVPPMHSSDPIELQPPSPSLPIIKLKPQLPPAPPRPAPPPQAIQTKKPETPTAVPTIPSPEEHPPPSVLTSVTSSIQPPELIQASSENSSLILDPTAIGPVTTFSSTLSRSWLPGCADFPFRRRNPGSPHQPYPTLDCLLVAFSDATGVFKETLWTLLCETFPDSLLDTSLGLSTEHLTALCGYYFASATVRSEHASCVYGVTDPVIKLTIRHTSGFPGHFELVLHGGSPSVFSSSSPLSNSILRFTHLKKPLPIKQVHNYVALPHRAKNLSSNLKNSFDGIMASANPLSPSTAAAAFVSLDNRLDFQPPRCVQLVHIAGFAGCGKSLPIQKLLRHNQDFRNFRVSVPTTELRNEWKKDLQLKASESWRINTWESSLLKTSPVLVVDEIYKMPRGYLDLSILADPSVQFVILLGDPLQGEYHSMNPSSSNHHLSSEVTHLLPYLDYYCLWSHRVPRKLANFFNIPSSNKNPGFCSFSLNLPTDPSTPILTCSQSQAKILCDTGHRAITISSSQGLTLDTPAHIYLDRNVPLLSPSNVLVALTRSRVGLSFTGDSDMFNCIRRSTPILEALFSGRQIDLAHHFPSILSRVNILTSPLPARRTLVGGASSHSSLPSGPRPRLVPALVPGLNSFSTLPSAPRPGPAVADPPSLPLSQMQGLDPDSQHDVVLVYPQPFECEPQRSADATILPETRRPLHFELPFVELSSPNPSPAVFSDTAFSHSYPGIDWQLLAGHFLSPFTPEEKGIMFRGTLSSQFPHLNIESRLGPQPLTLSAASHNSKRDSTLLPASIKKRLRFRPSSRPYTISPADQLLGHPLFLSLCKAYQRSPDPIGFDFQLFVDCIELNNYSQLTSKTQKTIQANAYRSDPDWRWSAARIFAKTQHKVNEGSIFGPWKACQTLALLHDAVILIFGPIKKYQRHFDDKDRPPHLYVHAGKTPHQLSSWCQQHLTPGPRLANDYTAFDQSQGGEAVVLEVLKMRRVSIPEHLIQLHKSIKTSITTQFGPLTCMRLTGEPGTYDDNTDYNTAILYSQFQLGSTPVLVSGDDSLIDRVPLPHPGWTAISNLLLLRPKPEISNFSLFCGYFVGPEGAVRAPRALFTKFAIAFDLGELDKCLASFLAEFTVGHSLGDAVWNLIPPDLLVYQFALFDAFCRECSREQKVALRLGEIPDYTKLLQFDKFQQFTFASFSLLKSSARRLYLRLFRGKRVRNIDPTPGFHPEGPPSFDSDSLQPLHPDLAVDDPIFEPINTEASFHPDTANFDLHFGAPPPPDFSSPELNFDP
ncbi:replication-associated polyprotein [Fig fleck-associated virus 2]|nr:replication-associated polyprotein [Fig fleck-associated virus 2]